MRIVKFLLRWIHHKTAWACDYHDCPCDEQGYLVAQDTVGEWNRP